MRTIWPFVLLSNLRLTGQPAALTVPTDVLLLISGNEVRGRGLTITPSEVGYLPAPASARATRPDTLHLPVASVFLVRYANGTREVLAPSPPPLLTPPDTEALQDFSGSQRQQLGQADAWLAGLIGERRALRCTWGRCWGWLLLSASVTTRHNRSTSRLLSSC